MENSQQYTGYEPGVEAQTNIAKCENCGANLTFSPADKCLICDHCGTKKLIDLTKYGEEIDFAMLLKASNTWSEETHVYTCNNCGAKHLLARSEIARTCSFCGTSNIVETQDLCGLKPNAVLPFTIDKKGALTRIRDWCKKRFFAPKEFRKNVKAEEICGVYNPAFTFDSDTFSTYSGRLGRKRYETYRRDGKSYTRVVIDYFSVSGNFSQFFDDVLVQASTAIKSETLKKLAPFPTNNANAYSQDFLRGFSANQYTKNGEECWGEAKQIITKKLRSAILAQYTYDVVDYLNVTTSCSNITYKYMLLPLYVGHTLYHKKLYNFYMNGRNGKITGKAPIAWLKWILIFGGTAIVIGVGAFLLHYFGVF